MCLVKECVKFVVLAFNLIFVLVGAALITLGTFYKINFNGITDAIPDPYVHLDLIPILTIVVGSVIFLIAFFGCCGTVRNSPCLLTTYAVILLTLFILQIALGVFAFLEVKDKDDLKKNVDQSIAKIFSNYQKEQELVDFIQDELECCGTDGPEYWTGNIPKTCCEGSKNCTINNSYEEGCQDEFYDFLVDAAKIIGITVLALSVTEVVGATLSLCLANSARNDMRRSGYY